MKRLLSIYVLSVLLSAASLAAEPETEVVYVDVNGLVCDFCARALEKVFGRQPEVEAIAVDLSEKLVTVQFVAGKSLDDDTLTRLINDSGYHVRGIRHGE